MGTSDRACPELVEGGLGTGRRASVSRDAAARTACPTSVAFRSAKVRSFAEQKTTLPASDPRRPTSDLLEFRLQPARGSLKAELQRRGITLLEVLISIFVLAVGLLSVASLVPVASFQVQRAHIDDVKALVGQQAARDVRVRACLRPDYWYYANGKAYVNPLTGVLYGYNGNGTGTGSAITRAQAMSACAIDPCMLNRFPFAKNPNIGIFATDGKNFVMPRCGLSNASGPAADQLCQSLDDLVFDINPNDPDALPGTPPGTAFNPAGTKRKFQGQFSWLATFVPVRGDLLSPAIPVSRNAMILSVVVFNQRPTGVAPGSGLGSGERAAPAQIMPPGTTTFGAGELQISQQTSSAVNYDQAKADLAVNAGEWIMLGAMVNNYDGLQTSGAPTTRPMFRWYRVVSAGPILAPMGTSAPAGSPQPGDNATPRYARDLTITGPDWNLGPKYVPAGTQFWAFIYDGAVAVYERTVHLEGPSMWSN